MLHNDEDLNATMERIARFQQQVADLRRVQTSVANHKRASSGFLAGMDRVQCEVREYLRTLPAETAR